MLPKRQKLFYQNFFSKLKNWFGTKFLLRFPMISSKLFSNSIKCGLYQINIEYSDNDIMARLLQNTDSMRSAILFAPNRKNQLVEQTNIIKAKYIAAMWMWLISFTHHDGNIFASIGKQPMIFKCNFTKFNTFIAAISTLNLFFQNLRFQCISIQISRLSFDF